VKGSVETYTGDRNVGQRKLIADDPGTRIERCFQTIEQRFHVFRGQIEILFGDFASNSAGVQVAQKLRWAFFSLRPQFFVAPPVA
jgi:hypothetical protein